MSNETRSIGPSNERRTFAAARAFNRESREMELSFASAEPVERWYGMEILSMDPADVDLARLRDGGPVLLGHDPEEHIGVVVDCTVDGTKARAKCKLSRNASEIMDDIEDGILTKASVGYMTTREISNTVDEKGVRTITWAWMPYEISLVSVPADNTVGVGRSAEMKEAKPATREKDNMSKENAAPVAETGFDASEIVKLARKHNAKDALVDQAIAEKWTAEKFRSALLDEVKPAAPVQGAAAIGMSRDEVKRYSFMNVVRALSGDKSVDIGFEREVSEQAAKKQGRAPQGIVIPVDVMLGEKRDLAVSGTGSNLVATNLMAGSFIDALRAKTRASDLGVQFMSGLVGDVALPKLSTTSTAYWVTEGVSPTESTPVMAQVTGTPHTVGTFVDISRKLLKQSTPDAEQVVRNDLVRVLAIELDRAIFAGSGSGGEPLGIVGTTGVSNPSVTTGTPTHAEILGFIQAVGDAHADMDMAQWAFTFEVWVKLASIFTNATYGSVPLADPISRKCVGFPYIPTNQVGANTAIFGDFSKVTAGLWGGLDLTVDPYTGSSSGTVRVVALQDIDIMVRQPGALAYNSAVTS